MNPWYEIKFQTTKNKTRNDHDEILMDAVTDLLPALAKCMGSGFETILRQLFNPLMQFAVRLIYF